MTTSHLIPYLDLTLLGDVDLGHLDDTRGELVSHRLIKLTTTELGVVLLRLLQIVSDDLGDELIGVFVARPTRVGNLVVVESL